MVKVRLNGKEISVEKGTPLGEYMPSPDRKR